eukprot:m.145055 g.145055  ORF g.145055 m.145055 type:complete len:119 (+) comp17726_c0_seq20:118-474(+)
MCGGRPNQPTRALLEGSQTYVSDSFGYCRKDSADGGCASAFINRYSFYTFFGLCELQTKIAATRQMCVIYQSPIANPQAKVALGYTHELQWQCPFAILRLTMALCHRLLWTEQSCKQS